MDTDKRMPLFPLKVSSISTCILFVMSLMIHIVSFVFANLIFQKLFPGPLPKTSADFWRMIWEQQALVIVMTTRVVERGRTKCGQYWPPEEGESLTFGNFEVTSGTIDQNDDYTVTSLTLTNTKVIKASVLYLW